MALLDTAGGKFVYANQCAYAKVGKTGRSVKKRTGWLSNNEVILDGGKAAQMR